jgi:hypothetical protein
MILRFGIPGRPRVRRAQEPANWPSDQSFLAASPPRRTELWNGWEEERREPEGWSRIHQGPGSWPGTPAARTAELLRVRRLEWLPVLHAERRLIPGQHAATRQPLQNTGRRDHSIISPRHVTYRRKPFIPRNAAPFSIAPNQGERRRQKRTREKHKCRRARGLGRRTRKNSPNVSGELRSRIAGKYG